MKRLTTEEFIEKSKLSHEIEYDYSKSVYLGNRKKVCIICPIHGEFWQNAKNHMNGDDCPKCGKEIGKKKLSMGLDAFLNKAKKIHGDKYDFSLVKKYQSNKDDIEVICKRCGKHFHSKPNWILSGHGCKSCETLKKYKGSDLLKFFAKLYNKKYSYPNISSKKNYWINDVITIVCPKHGNFSKKIKDHLRGKGCKICSNKNISKTRKLSQEEIEKRLKKLCDEKFSYDIDTYIGVNNPMEFKCLICGKMFKRTLNALAYNTTCPHCKGTARVQNTEWFVDKAKQKYGDKYDYSKSEYVNTDKKVIVICHEKDVFGKEHGEFLVTPHAHLSKTGSGCPKCSQKYHTSTEEFIEKAKLIHGDKYDYSKTEYVRALSPVMITCPVHGDFEQKPNSHLSGEGCPICNASHMEKHIRDFLNENHFNYIQEYTPEWLKPLHIDFYIEEKNVAIECQGLQHFKSVKYYGGDKGLEKRIERDNRKKKLCEEHGIKLLYYADYNYNFPYEVITDKESLLKEIKK